MVYRIELYVSGDDGHWKTAQLYICVYVIVLTQLHSVVAKIRHSICENNIAIIVSSMPAVASVSRGKTSLESWLACMRSRLSRSKSRLTLLLTNSNPSYQSETRGWPSSGGVITGQDSREGIYLQIYENRREGDYEMGLVTTEVRGEGECPRTLEEGVIRKSVEVHQSTRHAPPAT